MAAKQAAATHSPILNGPQSPTEGMFVKEEDEELAALGGKTRLISRKSPSAYSNPSSPQESSQQSASPIEQAVAYMPTEMTPPPQASTSSASAAPAAMMGTEVPQSPESVHGTLVDGTQWGNGGYVAGQHAAAAAAEAGMYDYGYPDMTQWQQATATSPTNGHMHMQSMSLDMHALPVQYNGYEQVGGHSTPTMGGHPGHHPSHPHPHHPHHPHHQQQQQQQHQGHHQAHPQQHPQQGYGMQPQSPVHAHHLSATDPHASWNYLFAQFNQV